MPPPDRYRVIYADPPWTFATYSHKGKGRSAEAYYDCMSLDAIKALPVAEWAARDCVLLLWATDPLLPAAFEVIRAWGFTYKTVGFYWAKLNKSASRPFEAAAGRHQKADCRPAPRTQPQTRRSLRAHRGALRGPVSRTLRTQCAAGLGPLGQRGRAAADRPAPLARDRLSRDAQPDWLIAASGAAFIEDQSLRCRLRVCGIEGGWRYDRLGLALAGFRLRRGAVMGGGGRSRAAAGAGESCRCRCAHRNHDRCDGHRARRRYPRLSGRRPW